MVKLNFFPKDKKFYVLFNNLSECLVDTVAEFGRFVETYPDTPMVAERKTAELAEISGTFNKLLELDRKCDKVSDELRTALFSTFVTPLDREDIHGLNKTLTSITEHVSSAARRFDMYHVNKVEPAVLKQADVLLRCVKELQLLIGQLDNLSSLERFTPHIETLNQLEKEGDRVYRGAMKELFWQPEDLLHVMKWKDIYGRIEDAIDKCNQAGTIIMGIILKYA
ncbi:MAG: hypothetical protein CVV27_02550 [Candidatus Melainabacteria bacterium HGW-Melainabacteria-1]|nr:MAG: hypothetical protein CVV27_02550 [Candidatus Melainabacteria bacterium HGW-Melainabacteria-1]